MKNNKIVQGTVRVSPKGFGFFKAEGYSDLFVKKSLLAPFRILSGDTVAATIEDGAEPAVKRIALVSRPRLRWATLVESPFSAGTLIETDAFDEFPGAALRFNTPVDLAIGDVVVVETSEAARLSNPAQASSELATFVSNLGPSTADDYDMRFCIEKWALPGAFSQAAMEEAASFEAPSVETALAEGYADLTALPFVTIDGESTRDFDDAIYTEALSDGSFRVLVAIADVSAYVKSGSSLDQEAKSRGTSIYLPDRVLPMLPPELCNNLCSLMEGQLRLALVCELEYRDAAGLPAAKLYRAVIRSAARLTYAEVLDASSMSHRPIAVQNSVQALVDWFCARSAPRKKRGIPQDRAKEPKFVSGSSLPGAANQKWTIAWLDALPSHEWVEEAMLAANQAAAAHLRSSIGTAMFRHQAGIDPERWNKALQNLPLPLQMNAPVMPELEDLQALFATLDSAQARSQLTVATRRSLTPALYSSTNSSHFSLGFETYTHFTSPIRRYADLVVHRLIVESLTSSQPVAKPPALPLELAAVAEQASGLSRRAKVASRFCWEQLKRKWAWRALQDTDLPAMVVSSSATGCRLSLTGVEALVSVTPESMTAGGWVYSASSKEWVSQEGASLMEGAFLKVRICKLTTNGPLVTLQAELVSNNGEGIDSTRYNVEVLL